MWELDYEESWAPKNWCFWTVVLEKTLASLLDCKEIQPVHPKGDQSWVFIGRTDVEAETPILWPPHAKSWVIGKDPDAGRDWGQEEKGMTEDEMAGWYHWLDGREFGWILGVGDGQGDLACCNSWVAKSRTRLSDWTELNWRRGSLSIYPPTLLHHWLRGILGVGSPALPTHSVKVQCTLLVWLWMSRQTESHWPYGNCLQVTSRQAKGMWER